MSLISNRKRPRGLSETFDNSKGKSNQLESTNSNTSSPTNTNNNTLTFSIESSNTTLNDLKYPRINEDVYIIEDEAKEAEEEDDDIIILEERAVENNFGPKQRRNNSDSILSLDLESFNAYNMFNVNQVMNNDKMNLKKQRTNSLPQLPQAKCFYNKIPSNYILQEEKLGEIKTNIIPYKLNLPNCDDKDGHYVIRVNDLFANRYIIVKLLGQGTFGKVVECFDKIAKELVAIKIIRNIPKYRDAARIELRILSTLKKYDEDNQNHCIHLKDCFDYRGHICIVTDLLKISLYNFLENNKFIPYPGSHIQAISKQLIRSVSYFHDLNLIHTDLKPENILLHDDSYQRKKITSKTIISSYLKLNFNEHKDKLPVTTKILNDPLIQIIDFGSAIFDDEYHSSIVSTRHYRAPEIVLGVGWSFPCDMWSVGCILVELLIGDPLFRTHDNLEHLAMIEKICGYQIDKSMVKKLKRKENECGLKYFTNNYQTDESDSEDSDVIIDDEIYEDSSFKLIFPTISTPSKFIDGVNQLNRIDLYISNKIGLNINFDYSLNENYNNNCHLINYGNFTFWWFFIDLLKKLFIINPLDRITALEALEHPWFNLGIEDEGTI